MARSTFEGPVLAGGNRFGPLRNVGYMQLVQDANIVLTNTTNATAGYGGVSSQFVNGNGIPNAMALFTPLLLLFTHPQQRPSLLILYRPPQVLYIVA